MIFLAIITLFLVHVKNMHCAIIISDRLWENRPIGADIGIEQ